MLGHAQGELLAQIRPDGTSAVTLFEALQLRVEVTLILVCIDSDGPSTTTVALYHDVGGTTYADTNIIDRQTRTQLTQDSKMFQAQHPGSGIFLAPGDSLGVAVGDADDVVVSVYGISESRVAGGAT